MKRAWALILGSWISLLISLSAEARPLLAIGQGLRWEKAASGREFENTRPYSLRAGYTFSPQWASYFEYVQTEGPTSGESFVQVRSAVREYVLWGRLILLNEKWLSLYGGAGAGIHRTSVETSFQGNALTRTSEPQPLSALALGLLLSTKYGVEIHSEARWFQSTVYPSQNLVSFALFLGYQF